MPNKTIYVAESDLPLYDRAQELAGGNLSAAVTTALRRYVEVEEGREAGFKEVRVQVARGGVRRKLRFVGVLIGEWGHTRGSRVERFRVYRTRKGRFALHVYRSPEWTSGSGTEEEEGLWGLGDWRGLLGLRDTSWGFVQGEATLEVFDTLEELREKVPPELSERLSGMGDPPPVEDLDI